MLFSITAGSANLKNTIKAITAISDTIRIIVKVFMCICVFSYFKIVLSTKYTYPDGHLYNVKRKNAGSTAI